MNATMWYYFPVQKQDSYYFPNSYQRDLCIYVFPGSNIDVVVHNYYIIFELRSITPCGTM